MLNISTFSLTFPLSKKWVFSTVLFLYKLHGGLHHWRSSEKKWHSEVTQWGWAITAATQGPPVLPCICPESFYLVHLLKGPKRTGFCSETKWPMVPPIGMLVFNTSLKLRVASPHRVQSQKQNKVVSAAMIKIWELSPNCLLEMSPWSTLALPTISPSNPPSGERLLGRRGLNVTTRPRLPLARSQFMHQASSLCIIGYRAPFCNLQKPWTGALEGGRIEICPLQPVSTPCTALKVSS